MKLTLKEIEKLLFLRMCRCAERRAELRERRRDESEPEDWDKQEGSCLEAYMRHDPYHGERLE